MINYEFPPLGGGAGNATDNLSGEMVRLGAEVVVLTSAFRGLPRRELRDGFTIQRVPAIRQHLHRSTPLEMSTFILSATVSALLMVRSWRPDLTIAFFGIPSGLVAFALRLVYGIPFIISLRGGDVPGFQPYELGHYHRFMGSAIRYLWKKASGVVANSVGLRTLAERSARNITVETIPNGVDVETFRPKAPLAARDPLRILFVGRLTYQKGVDLLLKGAKRLDRRTQFEVSLVGDGSARLQLENLVRDLGLRDYVHFVGWYPRGQMPKQYQEADIFVLPSRDEGMPNVILEAMACGLPVVATRISGNEEVVQDGTTGLLVPREDPAALNQALTKLANDSALRGDMGRAGRALVEKRYTWRQVAEAYLALIECLLEKVFVYDPQSSTTLRTSRLH